MGRCAQCHPNLNVTVERPSKAATIVRLAAASSTKPTAASAHAPNAAHSVALTAEAVPAQWLRPARGAPSAAWHCPAHSARTAKLFAADSQPSVLARDAGDHF